MGNSNTQIPSDYTASSGTITALDINSFATKCGSGVYDRCKGQTVDISTAGFTTFIGMLTDAVFFINGFGENLIASNMTIYLAKAYAMFFCAFDASYLNLYLVLEAAYYFTRYFGYNDEMMSYVNQGYEYICTCDLELTFVTSFGLGNQNAEIMAAC